MLLSHNIPVSHIELKVEFGDKDGQIPLADIKKKTAEYKSAENVVEAINADGILQTKFKKSNFSTYPTAYVDTVLEIDHKRKYALECDLTFWAVHFLYLIKKAFNYLTYP